MGNEQPDFITEVYFSIFVITSIKENSQISIYILPLFRFDFHTVQFEDEQFLSFLI